MIGMNSSSYATRLPHAFVKLLHVGVTMLHRPDGVIEIGAGVGAFVVVGGVGGAVTPGGNDVVGAVGATDRGTLVQQRTPFGSAAQPESAPSTPEAVQTREAIEAQSACVKQKPATPLLAHVAPRSTTQQRTSADSDAQPLSTPLADDENHECDAVFSPHT
jgi:hypothetical protein